MRIFRDEGSTEVYYYRSGLDVLAEYDGDDRLLQEYIYGATGVVAQRDPAKGLAFYFKDHLGSTRNIQTTAARMRVNYYPFGEQHTVTGDETNHLFTGKELDNTTDLYYFGARYYDPSIGRFISVDPAHQDHSPYSYCANNPLTRTDSDGRVWDTIVDIVSVGYSAYEFAKDPSWGNAGLLAADVGGAFVPFIPSPGSVRLASKVVAHADDVIDAGRTGDKIADAAKIGTISDETLQNAKSYQTYTKTNPETGKIYVGRTSGTDLPEANIAKRDKNHHMNDKGFGPAELDKSSSNSKAIRGREQQMIEYHGGAKAKGGSSGNTINGISDKNPNRNQYLSQSTKEFGNP
jgi:RHS repeat-associated protein